MLYMYVLIIRYVRAHDFVAMKFPPYNLNGFVVMMFTYMFFVII